MCLQLTSSVPARTCCVERYEGRKEDGPMVGRRSSGGAAGEARWRGATLSTRPTAKGTAELDLFHRFHGLQVGACDARNTRRVCKWQAGDDSGGGSGDYDILDDTRSYSHFCSTSKESRACWCWRRRRRRGVARMRRPRRRSASASRGPTASPRYITVGIAVGARASCSIYAHT